MKKTNILVADDENMIRNAISMLLKMEPFVSSVYEAWDEESLTDTLTNHPVDIILLDMKLGRISGLELFNKIKRFEQRPYVIAFTGLSGAELMVNLMKAGIDGIVHKLDSGYTDILKAIESTSGSGGYFSKEARDIVHDYWYYWDAVPSVILSFKEKEFLKALAQGLTTQEIAPLFNMTAGSIEQFRSKLMKKLGVPNTAALIAFAFRNGII